MHKEPLIDVRRNMVWAVLAVATTMGLASCASPNIYGTARTVPKGTISHTIAAEGIGAVVQREDATTGETSGASGFLPAFPAYQARFGINDEMDLGARFASLGTLGIDFKYNFLRSPALDLALDPGIQSFFVKGGDSAFGLAYFYLPLLVDINLSKHVSLVFTPGAMVASAFGAVDMDSKFAATGVMLRAGAGVNFRISERFALQPEVTVIKPSEGESLTSILYSAGIGFNFGALPTFGE